MSKLIITINQTGGGDPPPKDPIKPHRQPVDDTTKKPKK